LYVESPLLNVDIATVAQSRCAQARSTDSWVRDMSRASTDRLHNLSKEWNAGRARAGRERIDGTRQSTLSIQTCALKAIRTDAGTLYRVQ
jgi:hypothetical protein